MRKLKDVLYKALEFIISVIPEKWTTSRFMDWWGCPGPDVFCQHITFFGNDKLTITFNRKFNEGNS